MDLGLDDREKRESAPLMTVPYETKKRNEPNSLPSTFFEFQNPGGRQEGRSALAGSACVCVQIVFF